MKPEEKKKILFAFVKNARRSQMAQGFAEKLGKGKLEVYSAGSRPASLIDPLLIEVMKEKAIDPSSKRPKSLNDLPPIEMDYLVTMGCEETCPAFPARKIIEWQIPDPKGKPIDEIRRIRDVLEVRVKMLLEEV
jgi:arsenate reductase